MYGLRLLMLLLHAAELRHAAEDDDRAPAARLLATAGPKSVAALVSPAGAPPVRRTGPDVRSCSHTTAGHRRQVANSPEKCAVFRPARGSGGARTRGGAARGGPACFFFGSVSMLPVLVTFLANSYF
jgi:hypothetical protein